MDVTTINKKVRQHLLEHGIDNDAININLPFFMDGLWYVTVTEEDRLLNSVVLDNEGAVITSRLYPKKT